MSSYAPTDTDAPCRPATAAVRAGIDRDTAYGAVTPPIVLSSNFSFAGFAQKREYDYTRSGNPTRDLLAEALAELEGGAGAVVTATGMGAITLVLNALLEPGDRLVVPHDAYGGSWRLFNALAKKGHFDLITADLTDPRSLADALAQSPKLVLIETPVQPAAAHHRSALRHRGRAQGRRARGGGQHLPVAGAADPDRLRRRCRAAFHHQVHQRPQRRGRWRRDRP